MTGMVDENFQPGGGPNLAWRSAEPMQRQIPTAEGRLRLMPGPVRTARSMAGSCINFYSVDGVSFPFIETDANGQVTSGVFFKQNSEFVVRCNCFTCGGEVAHVRHAANHEVADSAKEKDVGRSFEKVGAASAAPFFFLREHFARIPSSRTRSTVRRLRRSVATLVRLLRTSEIQPGDETIKQ